MIPIAATLSRPTRAITSESVAFTARQISVASCSTQPGCGKCWVNSWYDATAGRPSTNTARLRTPVVPASIAITHESVLSTAGDRSAQAPGSDGYAGCAVRTELG